MQKTIFIVDDNDTNLATAETALEEQYRVLTLPSAERMFKLLEKIKPDLILLDIEMPEIDGFEALRRLKDNGAYSDIPIMFLTSRTDTATEVSGFQLGVIDFIAKPFSAPVLINRIKTHLDIDEIIRERTAQLQQLQNAIVFCFADIVESRDRETGGHIERTSEYIDILIRALLERDLYTSEIKNLNLDSLVSSARLHDVGKVTITDRILNKPAKLTTEEFEIMKTHSLEGEKIIDHMAARTVNADFLQNAKLFAGYHHERWDGSGYPYGLKEKEIPLQGRIMAIVDVYDALVSERPYKKAFPEEEALRIIMDDAGKHFDPVIAKTFYEIKDLLTPVRAKYL